MRSDNESDFMRLNWGGGVNVVLVRNEMERPVRTRVSLMKKDPEHGKGCWCPLCEKDVMAFALSSLPPRYARSRPSGPGWEETWEEEIEHAVEEARSKVTRHPKHSRWSPESFAEKVRLADFALNEGEGIVREGAYRKHGACSCRECGEDTLALALNRSRPRYGVSRSGTSRLPSDEREDLRRRLAETFESAAISVAARPRHTAGRTHRVAESWRNAFRQMMRRVSRPS